MVVVAGVILTGSFIQGLSRIVTSLAIILRTTGSSVALASRVDDNEGVGGSGTGAESSGSIDNQAGKTLHCDVNIKNDDKKPLWLGLRDPSHSLALRTLFTHVTFDCASEVSIT